MSGAGSIWSGRLPDSTLTGKSRQGYGEHGGLDSNNVLVSLGSVSNISVYVLTATQRGLAVPAQGFCYAPLPWDACLGATPVSLPL